MLKVILMLIYLAPGQPPQISEYPDANGVLYTVESCAARVAEKMAQAADLKDDDGVKYIAACRIEKIAGRDA